ncbi:MAG: hypothetical protein AAGI45_15920, partial [Cyanobacteria bacterium P01_H01_bin.26]
MKFLMSLDLVAKWPLLAVLLTVNLMVVLVSVWDGASRGDVLMSFDEDSVHTWVSAIQLLATAVVSA